MRYFPDRSYNKFVWGNRGASNQRDLGDGKGDCRPLTKPRVLPTFQATINLRRREDAYKRQHVFYARCSS